MVAFARLHSLGLKPGVCCKQSNMKENMACLTCRCDDDEETRENNGHCTSCEPGQIFLQDVTGIGTCQEWDEWKHVYSESSKSKIACPLYPYHITKLQVPSEGFACYQWGWFKERIVAAANPYNVKVHVRPLCKAM